MRDIVNDDDAHVEVRIVECFEIACDTVLYRFIFVACAA